MFDPLVSILIPSYNHEKYVEQCLGSIYSQTYKNIEIIIINDGSQDSSDGKIRILEQMLKHRFTRFIYINKAHEGVCKTLNQALILAQGQYIMTFASDDVMLPWRVESQVRYLQSHPQYGVVYTDGYRIFSDGIIDVYKDYGPMYRFSTYMQFKEGYIFEHILQNLFNKPTPTMCIRRECFNKVGLFDATMISEDPDIYIRLAKEFQMGYINQVLTIHRMHTDNSGVKNTIILPLFESVKAKYCNSLLLTVEQRNMLLNSINVFMQYTPLV